MRLFGRINILIYSIIQYKMPKLPIDHSNTIIYKLVHKEDYENANIYIGSTTDFDDNNYNGAMFKDKDKGFAKEWFKYHLENAKLRPLCKCCNLTRIKTTSPPLQ